MKDLYTFDLTRAQALETYYAVRDAYCSFFDSFKIPYLVAEADSGTMGGNLSHEFHFLTTKGEDNVIRCSDCQYVANEELARSGEILPELNQIGEIPEHNVWAYECEHEPSQNPPKHLGDADIATTPLYFTTWTGVTRDRRTLVLVHYPRNPISGQFVGSTSVSENEVNPYGVKALVDQVDAGVETPVQAWAKAFVLSRKGDNVTNEHSRIVRLFDYRMRGATFDVSTSLRSLGFTVSDLIRGLCPEDLRVQDIFIDPLTNRPLDLLKIRNGDPCPKCSSGHLTVHRAVELGHTFFLGTRYSKALQATVAISSSLEDEGKPRDSGTEASTFQGHDFGEGAEQKGQSILEMGCHGIGISRMIAVVADSLADRKGLNWPRVIAPFDVVLIPSKGEEDAATEVYDRITASGLRRGFPGPSVYTAPLEDTIDVIIDDRARDLAWKLGDADLIGYPVIVVLGRAWRKDRKCEVQCRRIRDLRTEVSLDDLSAFILSLLKQL